MGVSRSIPSGLALSRRSISPERVSMWPVQLSIVREITVALFVGELSELATVPAFRCELGEHADTYFPHDA